jgi:hypothetical protein
MHPRLTVPSQTRTPFPLCYLSVRRVSRGITNLHIHKVESLKVWESPTRGKKASAGVGLPKNKTRHRPLRQRQRSNLATAPHATVGEASCTIRQGFMHDAAPQRAGAEPIQPAVCAASSGRHNGPGDVRTAPKGERRPKPQLGRPHSKGLKPEVQLACKAEPHGLGTKRAGSASRRAPAGAQKTGPCTGRRAALASPAHARARAQQRAVRTPHSAVSTRSSSGPRSGPS